MEDAWWRNVDTREAMAMRRNSSSIFFSKQRQRNIIIIILVGPWVLHLNSCNLSVFISIILWASWICCWYYYLHCESSSYSELPSSARSFGMLNAAAGPLLECLQQGAFGNVQSLWSKQNCLQTEEEQEDIDGYKKIKQHCRRRRRRFCLQKKSWDNPKDRHSSVQISFKLWKCLAEAS